MRRKLQLTNVLRRKKNSKDSFTLHPMRNGQKKMRRQQDIAGCFRSKRQRQECMLQAE